MSGVRIDLHLGLGAIFCFLQNGMKSHKRLLGDISFKNVPAEL